MHPVRTRASNFVYRGPAADVGDAWVERRPSERAVYLTWQLSEEERAAIAAGGTLRLGIYGMEPIPVVSLELSEEQELSVAGAALRDRALKIIAGERHEDSHTRPGWWTVSRDVWVWLNEERALDAGDGVPTLWGRPLIQVEGAYDLLEFHSPADGAEARA